MNQIEVDIHTNSNQEIAVPEKTDILDKDIYGVAKILKKEAKILLFFGAINIIFSGLSSPMGVIFILLGLAAYRFVIPAIFLVQGVVFVSAALSNLYAGTGLATIFSIILAVSGGTLIKRYIDYRDKVPNDAGRLFPWAGLILGSLILVGGTITFLALAGSIALSGSEQIPSIFAFFIVLWIQLGYVVLGVGLASVLEKYQPKLLSWLVLMMGLLFPLFQIFLIFS